jgi:hypothetical protein
LVLRGRFFDWDYYTVAAFGVIGAIFSVASRVQSFQAKPCQQSNMNYVMAWVRIGIGIVSAVMLYLVLGKSLGPTMLRAGMLRGAESAAVIGFLGGFAERLVPTLFGRAAQAFEESSGTPVQLAKARPSFDGHPAGVRPPA